MRLNSIPKIQLIIDANMRHASFADLQLANQAYECVSLFACVRVCGVHFLSSLWKYVLRVRCVCAYDWPSDKPPKKIIMSWDLP